MPISSDFVTRGARAVSNTAAILALALLAACGSNSSPTRPSPPAPPPEPIPDYAGVWSGTATTSSCRRDETFPVTGFCASATASPQPIRLQLFQTGRAVSGDLAVAGGSGAVTGTVAPDGSLSLQGDLIAIAGIATFTITVASWQTVVSGPAMTGTVQTIWSTAGAGGRGYIDAAVDLVR
jgi:hypothetical protein